MPLQIYLMDDGNSPHKRAFIASLRNPTVKYITGRDRKPGQINGKSENLNNALCNHIYKV
jgi:endoglucanase